jgi:DNA-binding LacI/PurR family transcriptional regulator
MDRSNHIPLYQQIYEMLKREINTRTPGENLPPERELCKLYAVDRVTVRRALSLLAEEGCIDRKRGRGTRILFRPMETTEKNILLLLYHGAHSADRISEPFYAHSMNALEQMLNRDSCRLIYSKISRADRLRELCERVGARGVLLAGMPDENLLEQCLVSTVPVVMYNNRMTGIPSVWTDNEEAAAFSAKHLLELGHTHIGFLHVPGFVNSDKRLAGYRTVLEQAKHKQLVVVECSDWTEESGYHATYALLQRAPNITALFGGNDSMAIGALRALAEAGLRVPEDLSVIGFDGILQSSLSTPPLTTLKVDIPLMAEAACMLLRHFICENNSKDIQAVVPARFIPRMSTGPAPCV